MSDEITAFPVGIRCFERRYCSVDPGAQTLLCKSNRMLSCPNGALPIAEDFDASVSVMSCGSSDTKAATGPLNIWPVGRLYNAG